MDMLRTALSDMPEVRIAESHNRFLVDFAKEHEASLHAARHPFHSGL